MTIEKAEECPKCGAGLSQLGYDMQQCPCGWDAMKARLLYDKIMSIMGSADAAKTGLFVAHRCWRCKDGERPCVQGEPRRCEYPHARND